MGKAYAIRRWAGFFLVFVYLSVMLKVALAMQYGDWALNPAPNLWVAFLELFLVVWVASTICYGLALLLQPCKRRRWALFTIIAELVLWMLAIALKVDAGPTFAPEEAVIILLPIVVGVLDLRLRVKDGAPKVLVAAEPKLT